MSASHLCVGLLNPTFERYVLLCDYYIVLIFVSLCSRLTHVLVLSELHFAATSPMIRRFKGNVGENLEDADCMFKESPTSI